MSSVSGGGGGSGQPAAHSLAFRVMRLCRPTLHVDNSPLKFDPCDLLFGEDLFDDPIAASHLPRLIGGQSNAAALDPADLSYRGRFLLQQPTDSLGLPGLLVLPQSFGYIHVYTCTFHICFCVCYLLVQVVAFCQGVELLAHSILALDWWMYAFICLWYFILFFSLYFYD